MQGFRLSGLLKTIKKQLKLHIMSTFDTLLTVFLLFDLSDTVLYYFYFCAVNWTCPGL